MRRMVIGDIWRAGADRVAVPRNRTFGTTRESLGHRLAGVLSPESLFRLVLAFFLATALWLYVTSRNAPEAAFPYSNPISISPENVGPNLTLTTVLPTVHVTIRPSVGGLSPPLSSFVAAVDLSGLHAGRYVRVPVRLQWNPNVPVVSWGPHNVALVLERVVNKDIPVRIRQLGTLPYGYSVTARGVFASPTAVRVSGASSFVKQVGEAVVPVSLSDARSSINADYAPVLKTAQGAPLTTRVAVSPPQVRVHAAIQQLASFQTLPILASIRGEPAAGFGVTSIQVNPPGLTAYGAPRSLSILQNLRTSTVRLGGLRAGRKTFTARLVHPRGVYFRTRTVRVTVTLGPVSGDAVTRVAVRPVGVPAGDTAVSKPSAVLVTITGPAPFLPSAGRRLSAVANVAGLGTGTFTVTPVIRGPRNVQVDVVVPTRVSVTVGQG
jgi:YbbR domain-containing protein